MKKHLVCTALAISLSMNAGNNIAFVDTFKTMRECDEGIRVARELDELRNRLSKEIESEAQKLAKQEQELKSKATTMKREALEKEERLLTKAQRELEDKVRDGEAELKLAMQSKTESLAYEVEKSIVEVAQTKNVDAVIDVTGRVLYRKDNNKDDITSDAILHVNNRHKEKSTQMAAKKDEKPKAAVAA